MATLTSISIIPDNTIIYLGDSVQYQVLATYSNDEVVDVTALASYSLGGSPDVAEFSYSTEGLLLSVTVGSDIVIASYGGLTATTLITIHNPMIVAQARDLVGRYQPTVDSYLMYITSQYQNSPKMMQWLRSFLDITDDIRELAENLSYYFSFMSIVDPESPGYVNNALTVKQADFIFTAFNACEGDQLDVVGEFLGQKRKIFIKQDLEFSPPIIAESYDMTDEEYRNVLKNRILINHWDGNLATLQAAWPILFPGGVVAILDNQNMTVDVLMVGAFSDLTLRLIKNDYIVPRPQGVLYTYYFGALPFFGFDRNDAWVSGIGIGLWM